MWLVSSGLVKEGSVVWVEMLDGLAKGKVDWGWVKVVG